MRLQAINPSNLESAVALLSEGFKRPPEFWRGGLRRLETYRTESGVGPIGQMMMVGDAPVGVVLTIGSRRAADCRDVEVVNLAGLYVQPKYRWLAPRMLQGVTSDPNVVYTDLSPSPEVTIVNERLGFETASRGVQLFCLPVVALTRRARARVIPFAHARQHMLSPDQRDMLARHQELGCRAAVLEAAGQSHPLLFYMTARNGLSVARLVFAESRKLVGDNIAAVARFLLRQGAVMLTIHADVQERMPGGIVWNRSAPVQTKGRWDRDRVDQAFSELVFLRL